MGKSTQTKSTTGTKPTARRRRSSNNAQTSYSDLSELLTAAGAAGVECIELEGVSVKFFAKVPTDDRHTALSKGASPTLPSSFQVAPLDPPQEVVTSPEDRARLEEIRQEQLMIDDPLDYEQECINRLMGNSVYA